MSISLSDMQRRIQELEQKSQGSGPSLEQIKSIVQGAMMMQMDKLDEKIASMENSVSAMKAANAELISNMKNPAKAENDVVLKAISDQTNMIAELIKTLGKPVTKSSTVETPTGTMKFKTVETR